MNSKLYGAILERLAAQLVEEAYVEREKNPDKAQRGRWGYPRQEPREVVVRPGKFVSFTPSSRRNGQIVTQYLIGEVRSCLAVLLNGVVERIEADPDGRFVKLHIEPGAIILDDPRAGKPPVAIKIAGRSYSAAKLGLLNLDRPSEDALTKSRT